MHCARRKTALRRVAQLRGANVGRRRLRGGRLYSGEAAVVGGDDHFGCFPPAEKIGIEDKHKQEAKPPTL